jgi:hypothetical protein
MGALVFRSRRFLSIFSACVIRAISPTMTLPDIDFELGKKGPFLPEAACSLWVDAETGAVDLH